MTEGDMVPEFNGLTTHLILRYAQNDKGGLVLLSDFGEIVAGRGKAAGEVRRPVCQQWSYPVK